MSLINQMLKDLEQRSRPPLDPEAALAGLHATEEIELKKNREKYKLMVSVLLCLTLFFFLVVHYHGLLKLPPVPLGKRQILLNTPPTTGNKDTATLALPVIPLTPTILTGIALQTQKELTSLRLLLNQSTLYRVNSNVQAQTITLVLENTRLVANLPIVDYMNSAIKDMQMKNETNGDLKIILKLNGGIELKQLGLDETTKRPELQLSFLRNVAEPLIVAQKAPIIEKQTKSVKTWMVDLASSEQYQQAVNFAKQGQVGKAVPMLENLVKKFPEYSAARHILAVLLFEQGKKFQAQQILQIGLQQQPFYLPYIELQARILVSEGKITQALNLLQKAAPSLEANPDYHAFIAALYQRQGQWALAMNLYEQILTLQPSNAVWWMGLGITFENLGKRSQALEAYARAESGDNLSPELKAFVRSRMHNL